MKPEYHVTDKSEECYLSESESAKENKTYIECYLSKEDIGNLLQDKAVTLLFLNDEYNQTGMIDIKMSEDSTHFNVSDELNNMINNGLE